ncbi:unnamed protein product [Allacma fusca]|uniref:Uncharacterized protein n=1 Tax=Allacma fusca TaxID=39272 RepID=A0A8J2KZ19_9HEXA|nr:unnamed protein product [Allacma fusca]
MFNGLPLSSEAVSPGGNDQPDKEVSPSTDATPQDEPNKVGCTLNSTCTFKTDSIRYQFTNPGYPNLEMEPLSCQYIVNLRPGYCALRVFFEDAVMAGKNMEGCSSDSVVIINSGDTPTVPQCGLLQGYEFNVRSKPNQPVKIVVTVQSSEHLWKIKTTQIPCSKIVPLRQPAYCGLKNQKVKNPGGINPPTSMPVTKLLKVRKRSLEKLFSYSTEAERILEKAALRKFNEVKIVRGNETGINEWPWQVLLAINGRPLCGGSLLTDQWVVTAAHCVNLPIQIPLVPLMTVDLGDHDIRTVSETRNQILRVAKIVPNVQYEPIRRDIALIKLAQRVRITGKTIRPVCLPISPNNNFEDADAVTTGWGKTENGVISPVLREANVKIVSNENCSRTWASLGEGGDQLIEPGMVCINGGDAGPCNGDSGGPLVVRQGDRYELVGLTSFGLLKGCALPGIPSVYTRLSSYLDWISVNTADT